MRGPRGYDAAKKVLGRKRVALVDADGTWLAVAVVPASVQDRDTLEALDPGKVAWPSLREAILDGAFTAASCHEWSNRHGMRHRVVERDPAQKGFVVLAGRWVVERSFGWLVHWGRLIAAHYARPFFLDVSFCRVQGRVQGGRVVLPGTGSSSQSAQGRCTMGLREGGTSQGGRRTRLVQRCTPSSGMVRSTSRQGRRLGIRE